MANRRMFSKDIVRSDAFLTMPLSAQALYYHLGMEADDDGILSNPLAVKDMIHATNDDLSLLISKKFVIAFEGGFIIIKGWRINNIIRADRKKPTQYPELLSKLSIESNNSYHLKDDKDIIDIQLTTKCQPSDNQMSAQVRLGQVSVGKVSKGKDNLLQGLEVLKENIINNCKEENIKKDGQSLETSENELSDKEIQVALLYKSIVEHKFRSLTPTEQELYDRYLKFEKDKMLDKPF
ncbi:MAG: hypothetical protein WC366_05530 [Bacilli bacterium]